MFLEYPYKDSNYELTVVGVNNEFTLITHTHVVMRRGQ